MVLLKVRDRVLFCQNCTHMVVVALMGPDGVDSPSAQASTLECLVLELQKGPEEVEGATKRLRGT